MFRVLLFLDCPPPLCLVDCPAWPIVRDQQFDLYLLHGLLPLGNSPGMGRDLHSYYPSTAILFYSAMTIEADIKRDMDAGAAGYLTKPFSGDLTRTVLETIRKAHKDPPSDP